MIHTNQIQLQLKSIHNTNTVLSIDGLTIDQRPLFREYAVTHKYNPVITT